MYLQAHMQEVEAERDRLRQVADKVSEEQQRVHALQKQLAEVSDGWILLFQYISSNIFIEGMPV